MYPAGASQSSWQRIVDLLDAYQEVAIVRAESYPYIDYLQLVKDEGQWLIVNILYTTRNSGSKYFHRFGHEERGFGYV